MFVASVALAVVLTGCGGSKDKSSDAEKNAAGSIGSAKGVAERFVSAVVRKDIDAAWAVFDPAKPMSREKVRSAKYEIEELSKLINDDKLEGKAIREVVRGGFGYRIFNGKKYTDEAQVVVQFVKGKDKKPNGMNVKLVAADGSWKVAGYKYIPDGLDTSDDEKEVAPRVKTSKLTRTAVYTGPVMKAEKKKYDMPAKKADYGTSSKVREFESACHELAKFARQTGEKVDESDVQKEINKFKTLSSAEQDKQLKEVKGILEMMKSANLKK